MLLHNCGEKGQSLVLTPFLYYLSDSFCFLLAQLHWQEKFEHTASGS